MTKNEATEFLRDLRGFVGEAMDALLDAINVAEESGDDELAETHRYALTSLEEAEGAISDAIGRYREP